MDVDDDDEYMNAAAAHAAFVTTVSAASMYWLLRHAQHARYINIHKLHPLPEKKTITKIGTVEPVTLKKPCLFHVDFNHDFNHHFLHSGTPLLQLLKLTQHKGVFHCAKNRD